MQQTLTTCDRCGADITAKPGLRNQGFLTLTRWDRVEHNPVGQNCDLCEYCEKAFDEWVSKR